MFSQAGQDFWVFREAFLSKTGGYFVDVGANDGKNLSNSYFGEKALGWNGICIEANPDIFPSLEKNRNCVCLNVCLDAKESLVNFASRGLLGGIVDEGLDNTEADDGEFETMMLPTKTLESVLEEQNAPSIIDYLSVDVEGAEERVLKGFSFDKYCFRTVTIERPSPVLLQVFKKAGYHVTKKIPSLDLFLVHEDYLTEYRENLFRFYQNFEIEVHRK